MAVTPGHFHVAAAKRLRFLTQAIGGHTVSTPIEVPQTRYTKSGDVHIAYQVYGDGPLDLVLVPGFVSHLEVHWDNSEIAAMLQRLGRFSRVICFDKRGTGLSDRGPIPTLEQRMDDVRVVWMPSAPSAPRCSVSPRADRSLVFAATYPARTTAVVIYGSYARRAWARIGERVQPHHVNLARRRRTRRSSVS